jgi:hypothetical protein
MRKNPVAFVMGRFVVFALVVTTSLHDTGDNDPDHCTV